MAEMIVKTCNNCGVQCWHNPTKSGNPRCTFCGTPAGNNGDKRAFQVDQINRQANRARILGITRIGVH